MVPGRIRAARDLRGHTQSEAVRLMRKPITAAALSQIEAGKVRPTTVTILDLADALEVPSGFFSAGAAVHEVQEPYFRHLRATPARERRRAGALAQLLNDLVAEIEHYVRLPTVEMPALSISPHAGHAQIDDAAEELRTQWNLANEPISHVVREIERHGVPVARLTLGHRQVDAFTVRYHDRPVVLLSEDKNNYVRSRFDASHELAHLVLHRDATPGEATVETQAQDFASAFLLPRSVALEELPSRLDSSSWLRLAQLKQKWGISMGALLYRAKALDILSPERYASAMKYMAVRGWRKNEPGDRQLGAPETPLMLERALREIEVRDGLTAQQVIERANLPIDDTIGLLRAAMDNRPIIEF